MNIELIRMVDYYIGIILIQFLRISKLIKPKKLISKGSKPKKILLIKFFGFGNLILASPMFYNIKKYFPDVSLHILTLNKNKGVLECYKEYLTKPVYFDMGGISLPIRTIQLLKTLRKEKYDLIIDLDRFSRYSAIITYLSNAKKTIGYESEGTKKHYLYDFNVKYLENKHIVEEFLNLLQPLNIKPGKKIRLIQLSTEKKEKDKIDSWIESNNLKNKKIIGIHTGVGYNELQRNWPYFKELIERLLKETEVFIVLTASQKEYQRCEKIINDVNYDAGIKEERIKIAKDIKLNELAYLMNRFDVFISNDTGPMHMAAAQGVNIISFYGPYLPQVHGPYTEKKQIFYKPPPCSPCMTNFNNQKTNCKNPVCMKNISINEVWSWLNSNFNKRNFY